MLVNNEIENENENYVVCAICGFKGRTLVSHLSAKHNMNTKTYREKYNSPTACQSYIKRASEKIKGENNPGYNHGGRLSPFSDKFIKGKDENIHKKMATTRKENGNETTSLEYWLKKTNGDVEEARKLLSQRQTTFSLQICIKKYGEDEGNKIWHDRQYKWQKTLNNKSYDELERITKLKVANHGYSKVSQELFDSIYPYVKDRQIYYATLNNRDDVSGEYFYISKTTNKKFLFDFYSATDNKIIEFDGEFWHGKLNGRKESDLSRQKILEDEGFSILRIIEKEYRTNKEDTINKCLEFLKVIS